MARQRYQRGTLRASIPAHGSRPERKLSRGEYWAQWYQYVRQPDGGEKRRQREKIITRPLAESHHVAKDYTGPLTKGDAQRVLDLLIAQDTGTYVPPDTAATVEQVAREYIALTEPNWGDKTRRVSTQIITTHIIGNLGPKLIADIDPLELQAWLNGYVQRGVSKSLLNKIVLYLRAIFDHAIARKVVLTNPARQPGQRLRAKSTKRQNNRALTANECQRLLSAFIGRDHLIVRMFIQLGLRPEEMFSLRPCDVRGDQVFIVDSKSEASEAPVYVEPSLLVELQGWLDTCSGEWLFTGPRGAQLVVNNYLNRVLRPAAKTLQIQGVNFQALRRTCGTLFGNQAKDPRLTQAQLRHADPQVTLKHYQQAIPESMKSAAIAFSAELGFTKCDNSEGAMRGRKLQ